MLYFESRPARRHRTRRSSASSSRSVRVESRREGSGSARSRRGEAGRLEDLRLLGKVES